MESSEVTFTLAYIVFAFCFVFTPNEFRSAGLTVPNLFSSWLGSEDVGFIQYHVKRTSITLLVHSTLPFGYYTGMCIACPEQNLLYIYQLNHRWQAFVLLSLSLQLASVLIVIYWFRLRWSNHPISRALQAHALPPYAGWGAVAASINTEFRRIDKFATGPPGARVVITDTWVLKVTTYYVHVALQSDSHLTVTESTQHLLSPDSATPTQILTLRVASINQAVKPFDISELFLGTFKAHVELNQSYTLPSGLENDTGYNNMLNSTEYTELREKLHAPIRNAANVVIHQTISELFLDTFKAHVELNQPYTLPSGLDLEPCIGCMQVPAGTKLIRLCCEEGVNNDSDCQQCFCRPMWCLSCLGRWFASRQDQQRPDTWLASRVPCPTCRAKFCILDISLVH